MDEIEQIGGGSISLSGTIQGELGDHLPVMHVNGNADQIGFRIKSLERDVRDISFNVYATNGGKADLSEGQLVVTGFSATFPDGVIKGDISAGIKPNLTSLKLNNALVEAIAISHTATKPVPPPIAGPLILPITGFGVE